MPPRFAYWTIVAGGLPTAFRATEREELLPTFNRLKEKHPDAEMKYFARGRLWASQEEARHEAKARRTAAALRQSARGGTSRGRDWRPGGEHRDPRQHFKDAKKERNLEWRKRRFQRHQKPGATGGSGAPPRPAERAVWRGRPPGGVKAQGEWRGRPPGADKPQDDWRGRPPGTGKPQGELARATVQGDGAGDRLARASRRVTGAGDRLARASRRVTGAGDRGRKGPIVRRSPVRLRSRRRGHSSRRSVRPSRSVHPGRRDEAGLPVAPRKTAGAHDRARRAVPTAR